MAAGHIVRSFTRDLARLSSMIGDLGELVATQIECAVQALADRNSALASEVAERDSRIDALEDEARRYGIQLLALRQPMARDLRFIVSAMSIATDLERLGDYVRNVAERTIEVNKAQPLECAHTVPGLGRLARQMTGEVMDAFADADADEARAVRRRVAELDTLHVDSFRELLAYLVFVMEDPRDTAACTQLLFIGQNFVHMGNLAADIAESVVYIAEGAAGGDRSRDHRPEPGAESRTSRGDPA